ncbi:MAG: glycoside hydrolase family 2 protein, partial [Armatimonadota bacterium]
MRQTLKLRRIDLNDGWRFAEADPGAEPAVGAEWREISLPGDVNAALVADGRVPSPHCGDDAKEGYWVTSNDWWLTREFEAPDNAEGTMELVLDGLDGHVDVSLNGRHLGLAKNAFRPHRYDISAAVRAGGRNVLTLRFRSIDGVMGGPREDELQGWGSRRVLMRKPQYNFGWDWALPMPGIGVKGGVWIEASPGPRLKTCSVKPLASGRLDFKFQVNTAARDAGYALRVRVSGHGADIEQTIERPGRCFSHTSITVDDPKLWWPRGMDEQPLYDYSVELIVDGEVMDIREGRLGIREVEILEEPFTEDAGPGISFWITVNGQRVFCKGGNWIPQELWPAEATEAQYRFHLQRAADANFNMLRVWGGGVYERDIFYDLCDELGIMVWQDFMFASAGYPVDLLRGEIIAEAGYQIRRLRNRPSLCLWCGCNEDVYSWGLPDEDATDNLTADTGVYSEPHETVQVNRLRDDPQIYSMILRGLVSRDGLGVPYIESSPQS